MVSHPNSQGMRARSRGTPSTPPCLAHTCVRALSPQDVHAGGVEEVL